MTGLIDEVLAHPNFRDNLVRRDAAFVGELRELRQELIASYEKEVKLLDKHLEYERKIANQAKELRRHGEKVKELKARAEGLTRDREKYRLKLEVANRRLDNLRRAPLGRLQVTYWGLRKRRKPE